MHLVYGFTIVKWWDTWDVLFFHTVTECTVTKQHLNFGTRLQKLKEKKKKNPVQLNVTKTDVHTYSNYQSSVSQKRIAIIATPAWAFSVIKTAPAVIALANFAARRTDSINSLKHMHQCCQNKLYLKNWVLCTSSCDKAIAI